MVREWRSMNQVMRLFLLEVAPGKAIAFLAVLWSLASRLAGAGQGWERGEWRLDEGRGEVIHDSSGHGNDGRLHGTLWVQTDAGPALQFTPSPGSYVAISNSPSLNLVEAIEIDLWARTYGATGGWQGLVAKRNDSNQEQKSQYQLTLTPDLELSYGVAFRDFWQPATGFRLNPGQWYHITATYDALLRKVEVAVDGKLVKTFHDVPVIHASRNPVWLGWTGYAREHLNGELRQVRIGDPVIRRIAELRVSGSVAPRLLQSRFLPNQVLDGAGKGLRGTIEALVLNPSENAQKVRLEVKLGTSSEQSFAELPGQARRFIRCTLTQPPQDAHAQVELSAGERVVSSTQVTINGSEAFLGFHGYVVSHTHSDFAWADSLAGCLDKNVAAVAKSVELAEKYPDFRFCMEHMLAVREYLRRNPNQLDTLRRLMREGRFEAGGFYTGPWELTSGPEALVRQLYFGKLWVQQTLGVAPVTVWNVDVAGHTAQLPQILAKAGIKGLVISAGSDGPGLLRWRARDGSSVLTWRTPWGYGASATLGLRSKGLDAATIEMPHYLEDIRRNASEYHLPKIGLIADGSDIQSPTEQVVENIRQWNSERRYPPLIYASTADLFAAVEKERLPEAAGEMPSPWDTVQSQGNECFMPDRRLDGQVLAAEKFAAFASVFVPSYAYPHNRFAEIWANRLYAFDHNWGGWHGAENDQLKAGKIQEAARLTEQVLRGAFTAIARQIHLRNPANALPIVVFNPLSWERHDVVSCELPPAEGANAHLRLLDTDARLVPCQVTASNTHQSVRIIFPAQVPSLGYATYYVSWVKDAEPDAFRFNTGGNTFENSFYRLELDPVTGGIKHLLDKRTGRELVRSNSRYSFNELMALEDDDVDIGLHLTGRQWFAREHPSRIQVTENGPVRLVIEIQGKLLQRSIRTQEIILYAELPRIDFVTKLDWEGKRNLQLYQTFPLNLPDPKVRYAVPYGWEQYGTEMQYAAPWFERETPPVARHRWRGVRGWVELAAEESTVSLASQCNYAAFEDVAKAPEPGFLIQPLLLRSVRSCGDGGKLYYEQKGRHEFRFSLETKADPARLGEELDSPLLCIAGSPGTNAPGALPERLSFLRVQPENVHIAVVKQAEDRDGLIVRLVEMREREKTTPVALRACTGIQSAVRTSLIEENQQTADLRNGAAALTLPPAAIETLRIRLGAPARP